MKEKAFSSGDSFKESKSKFRDAKKQYSENFQHQFYANDSVSVRKGLGQITNYKPSTPTSLLAPLTSWTSSTIVLKDNGLHQQQLSRAQWLFTPSPSTKVSPLSILKGGVQPALHKTEPPTEQLISCLQCSDIFNTSLETCHMPPCFKSSTIIPKKARLTGLSDYRPITLTSVVMKSFDRWVSPTSRTSPTPSQILYSSPTELTDQILLSTSSFGTWTAQEPTLGSYLWTSTLPSTL